MGVFWEEVEEGWRKSQNKGLIFWKLCDILGQGVPAGLIRTEATVAARPAAPLGLLCES